MEERPQQGQDLVEVGAPELAAVALLELLADLLPLLGLELAERPAAQRLVERPLGGGAAAGPPGLQAVLVVVEGVDGNALSVFAPEEEAHQVRVGVAGEDPQLPAGEL